MLRQDGGGFMGDAADGKFKIQRDINYRNSFLPIIKGTIEPAPEYNGSRITLRMGMHKAVIIFLSFWIGAVALLAVPLCIGAIMGTLQPPQSGFWGIVVPCGMLCFGIALPHACFWGEAKKAEKFLIETFRAEVELPPDPNRAL